MPDAPFGRGPPACPCVLMSAAPKRIPTDPSAATDEASFKDFPLDRSEVVRKRKPNRVRTTKCGRRPAATRAAPLRRLHAKRRRSKSAGNTDHPEPDQSAGLVGVWLACFAGGALRGGGAGGPPQAVRVGRISFVRAHVHATFTRVEISSGGG